MGYIILIGNAEPYFERIDDELWAEWMVRNINIGAKGNCLHHSYSWWSQFVKEFNLEKLFFDEKQGLMRDHSGCFIIDENHYLDIKCALDKYKLTDNQLPHILELLEHLEFWFRWALDNCKNPAIYNS